MKLAGHLGEARPRTVQLRKTDFELASQVQNAKPQEQSGRMLRITVVELSTSDVTLRVEGHFAGPWVEEVRRTCEAFRGSNPIQLHVELEDVSFIDSAGVAYLKELQKEGAVLAHVSPFLAELFKSDLLPDGFSSE